MVRESAEHTTKQQHILQSVLYIPEVDSERRDRASTKLDLP